MTLVLLRLTRSIVRCMKYRSYPYLDAKIECQNYYWRIPMYINAMKFMYRSIYKTRMALPLDYNKVSSFMNEAYLKYEPIMVNIGLAGQEPIPPLLSKFIYDDLKDGMTIIVEGQDNCIIGAAVNAQSDPSDSDKFIELASCCERGPIRDVIEFWAYVTRKSNLWERYRVRKIFECSWLAVGPDFRGQGIARKLVLDSWRLARDCGYRLFRLDCSSRYTAQIAESFGWKRICTIPFNQYIRNDEVVFKYIKEPHTEMQVYIDQITPYKDPYSFYKNLKKIPVSELPEKKTKSFESYSN